MRACTNVQLYIGVLHEFMASWQILILNRVFGLRGRSRDVNSLSKTEITKSAASEMHCRGMPPFAHTMLLVASHQGLLTDPMRCCQAWPRGHTRNRG